jgi:hypothetical protein
MGRAFDATGSYTATLIELGVIGAAAAGIMCTFPSMPRVIRTPTFAKT